MKIPRWRAGRAVPLVLLRQELGGSVCRQIPSSTAWAWRRGGEGRTGEAQIYVLYNPHPPSQNLSWEDRRQQQSCPSDRGRFLKPSLRLRFKLIFLRVQASLKAALRRCWSTDLLSVEDGENWAHRGLGSSHLQCQLEDTWSSILQLSPSPLITKGDQNP